MLNRFTFLILAAWLAVAPALATISIPFPGPGAAPACPLANSNISFPDLKTVGVCMTAWPDQVPTAGGTLTVNGQSMGSYDSRIVTGNQNVTTFTNSDWFTATADSRSAFVVIKGNFTIGSGQTFIPSNRKLFTTIYVTGDCTVTGTISMSARGANHSTSGSNIASVPIRIATGTFSGVTNPEIPAVGGSGAAGVSTGLTNGNTGGAGTAGGTAGGGSGGERSGPNPSGSGAAGTSFSGGAASAGNHGNSTGNNAGINGGAGSAAIDPGGGQIYGGGAGNPGGAGSGGGSAGGTGTGGTLILICNGAYTGAGAVTSAGVNGGATSGTGSSGAGSGGGSITVMYGSDSGPTPTAPGGVGGTGGQSQGGSGGVGTARKLAL